MDSLRMQLEQPDTVRIDSAAVRDSILKTTGIDSVALALRDSLYKVMYADKEPIRWERVSRITLSAISV